MHAYAADCRVRGRVVLGDMRLTDLLNATGELRLAGVELESLADGHAVELAELTVAAEELIAVVAAGPRGEPGRRLRTHQRRIEVETGPYLILGSIHGTPASDPLAQALRRAPWVPLTDAIVAYERAGAAVREEIPTLLVNRLVARSLRPVAEASLRLPWESPREPPAAAPPALDLTGALRDEPAPARMEPDSGGSGADVPL